MSMRLPITQNMKTLLSELELDVHFSHIGRRSLEKILYALDPSESNETIVNQREMLKKGTPVWIRLGIEEGGLSMDGEIKILDVNKEIPSVKRLNISNLSAVLKYEPYLQGMNLVTQALDVWSAAGLTFDDKGMVRFVK